MIKTSQRYKESIKKPSLKINKKSGKFFKKSIDNNANSFVASNVEKKEISMKKNFLQCEIVELEFGKSSEPDSTNGDVTIEWLFDSSNTNVLETGAREYQREEVATEEWKQEILRTILMKPFAKIPQIHIRVIKKGEVYYYELIDGQQRVSAPICFLKGEFNLPKNDMIINGIDIGGLSVHQLRQNHKNIYDKIFNYRISCVWYENLTDQLTADLFINILNNTNKMKPQEIRNAVRGFLSAYIRDTARFENHDLFEVVTTPSKNGKKVVKKLVNFSKSFNLNGRMEIDEWLSELIYMYLNVFRNGITQSAHTKWIKKVQAVNGDYSTKQQFNKLQKQLDELIDFSLSILKSVDVIHKERLTPVLTQMMILYGYELKNKYGKIHVDIYTHKFFEIYKSWSSTKDKLYANELMPNGKQMPPFDELFGGKNKNSIGSICQILDGELNKSDKDFDSFGVVEIDDKDFSRGQVIKKLYEQNHKCFYTGLPLSEDDAVGDHYIPRSWGVKKGGVTHEDNLVVTSDALNKQKGNQHGDDFIKDLKK